MTNNNLMRGLPEVGEARRALRAGVSCKGYWGRLATSAMFGRNNDQSPAKSDNGVKLWKIFAYPRG